MSSNTSYAHAKVGDVFYITWTYLNHPDEHADDSLVEEDVVFGSWKNGVATAPASAVFVNRGDGFYHYALQVSSTGWWSFTGRLSDGHVLFMTDVRAFNHHMDDVAEVVDSILAGQSGQLGASAVTVTVDDGTDPIQGVVVTVQNSGGQYLTAQVTDESGQVALALPDGEYTFLSFATGYTFANQDETVSGNTSVSISGASRVISPPSSPSLCRLYADFVNLDGDPAENFVVHVENLYNPSKLTVVQHSTEYTTNALGHVEFDVVQGAIIRVAFVGTNFTREITVPVASTQNLLTLMGAATDNFVVA